MVPGWTFNEHRHIANAFTLYATMRQTNTYYKKLFDFLFTLTPRKRSNVRALYFRPGEYLVDLCLEAYSSFKSIEIKSTLVEWVTVYAETNDNAFALGVIASKEKSQEINYWVCRLFAFAQRAGAIPILKEKLNSKKGKICEDAQFALNALASGNFGDFKTTSIWYPSRDNVDVYKRSQQEFNDSVDYYIVKELSESELNRLKEIVGDLYEIK